MVTAIGTGPVFICVVSTELVAVGVVAANGTGPTSTTVGAGMVTASGAGFVLTWSRLRFQM